MRSKNVSTKPANTKHPILRWFHICSKHKNVEKEPSEVSYTWSEGQDSSFRKANSPDRKISFDDEEKETARLGASHLSSPKDKCQTRLIVDTPKACPEKNELSQENDTDYEELDNQYMSQGSGYDYDDALIPKDEDVTACCIYENDDLRPLSSFKTSDPGNDGLTKCHSYIIKAPA